MKTLPLDPEVQAFAIFVKFWRALDETSRKEIVAGRATIGVVPDEARARLYLEFVDLWRRASARTRAQFQAHIKTAEGRK